MANPRIQRSDLASIPGISDRTARYIEGLSPAIDDVTTLTGVGSPAGVVRANRSRLYIDTDNNQLWFNVSAIYGDTAGWVMA